MAEERFRNKIQSLKDKLCLDSLPPGVGDFIHDVVRAFDDNFEAIKDEFDPLFDPDLNFDNRGEPQKIGDVDFPQSDENVDVPIPGGGGKGDEGGPPPPPPFPTSNSVAGYILTAVTVSEISGASGGSPGSGMVSLTRMGRPGGMPDTDVMASFSEAKSRGDFTSAYEILRKMEDPINNVDQVALALPSVPNVPTDSGSDEELVDGGDEEQESEEVISGVVYNIAQGKIKVGKSVIIGKDVNDLWWVLVEDCQEPED